MNKNLKKNVTIVVTSRCGLGCKYCFESETDQSLNMDFETAKNIVTRELTIDDGYTDVVLDLFGGEPFRNFTLIKQLFEYVTSRSWPKKYIFFSTTNGIYVHGEIKEWLKKRKSKYYCGVSLDGTPETHNFNRNNSWNKIDVAFFAEAWPDQPIKMTISPWTVEHLADNVIYLVENYGFEILGSFALGVKWETDKVLPLLKRELEKLVDYYVEHDELPVPSFISYPVGQLAHAKELSAHWCGAGQAQKSYYVDGTEYPCHIFSPLSNPVENDAWKKIDFKNDPPKLVLSSACASCFIRHACPSCYGMSFVHGTSIVDKDMSLCRLHQECVRAAARIESLRILKKHSGEHPMDLSVEEYDTWAVALQMDQMSDLAHPSVKKM